MKINIKIDNKGTFGKTFTICVLLLYIVLNGIYYMIEGFIDKDISIIFLVVYSIYLFFYIISTKFREVMNLELPEEGPR